MKKRKVLADFRSTQEGATVNDIDKQRLIRGYRQAFRGIAEIPAEVEEGGKKRKSEVKSSAFDGMLIALDAALENVLRGISISDAGTICDAVLAARHGIEDRSGYSQFGSVMHKLWLACHKQE